MNFRIRIYYKNRIEREYFYDDIDKANNAFYLFHYYKQPYEKYNKIILCEFYKGKWEKLGETKVY